MASRAEQVGEFMEHASYLLVRWTDLYVSLAVSEPQVKLEEEAEEFIEAEHGSEDKLAEGADVLIVTLTQLQKDGWDLMEALAAVASKLQVNLERQWRVLPNGALKHVKQEEQ